MNMDAISIGACVVVVAMMIGAGFDLAYQIKRERKAVADYRLASRLSNGKLGAKAAALIARLDPALDERRGVR